MKKYAFLGLFLFILSTITVMAQPGQGRNQADRLFDTNTVETVQGKVTAVDTYDGAKNSSPGVHVTLQTETGDLPVHLGPSWFITNQEMQLEIGDEISVVGSRITFNDAPALVAAEITRGDDVLLLRDTEGFPVWNGWRKGGKRGGQWGQHRRGWQNDDRPGLGRGQGPGRGLGRNAANRNFDPTTIETVSGQVVRIDHEQENKSGRSYGIHLIVKTANGELPVHLGPAWYIDNQELQVQVDDEIEVTGSRITYDDAPALIAAQIKKGDDLLVLRDDNGFPEWSGWRRSQ